MGYPVRSLHECDECRPRDGRVLSFSILFFSFLFSDDIVAPCDRDETPFKGFLSIGFRNRNMRVFLESFETCFCFTMPP